MNLLDLNRQPCGAGPLRRPLHHVDDGEWPARRRGRLRRRDDEDEDGDERRGRRWRRGRRGPAGRREESRTVRPRRDGALKGGGGGRERRGVVRGGGEAVEMDNHMLRLRMTLCATSINCN